MAILKIETACGILVRGPGFGEKSVYVKASAGASLTGRADIYVSAGQIESTGSSVSIYFVMRS